RAIHEVVLDKIKGRLVIFVDEIDYVRSLPFSTDEFFAGIREFYNRRSEDSELERLTFCLLGVATPSDLIRDTRTTPFNIGTRVELADFNEAEAAPLIQGLRRDRPTSSRLLKRILYWTGGHPYLTQRLCLSVAEDASVLNVGDIDRKCEELFLSSRARESDENLSFVRQRILRSDEANRASLLEHYQKIRNGKRVLDDENSPLVSILRLSGVTRPVSGLLHVRNRIYHRAFDSNWVTKNLPDAELRLRKRAIFFQRLFRIAAVLLALALITTSGLALVALRQREIALVEKARAETERERADQSARRLKEALDETMRLREIAEDNKTKAETQRGEAEKQRALAEATAHIAQDRRKEAEFQKHRAEEQRRQAVGQTRIAEAERAKVNTFKLHLEYSANMNLAAKMWDHANIEHLLKALNSYPKSGDEDLRGYEWFYFWRLAHSELLTLKGHTNTVEAVAFSPDGKRIVTGGIDDAAKVWDAVTGQELFTLKGHKETVADVAYSPDGKQIVTGSHDGTARVWDAATGQQMLVLRGHEGIVSGVAYSPDGKRIATSSYDTTAKIWDALTGQETLTLEGDSGSLKSVAFSPDGKRIVTGANDGTAIIWNADT
ncbi:MAG: AAA-like domain-containing protein, partial [Pyrinomonadaceae bacterium]